LENTYGHIRSLEEEGSKSFRGLRRNVRHITVRIKDEMVLIDNAPSMDRKLG
jgi:hypothetical protein